MLLRTFKHLNYLIDTDIKWRINSFHGQDGNGGVIGVCHDLRVNVGEVEVRTPVFVVDECNQDLLLGWPWERAVQASMINERDGSVTWEIRSADGRRVVRFVGVTGEHERNRSYARLPDEERDETDPLNM